jgi:lysophospholipase L1-like esterase
MVGRWRANRDTVWTFVLAVFLVLGAGAGVGAVVVAVADSGQSVASAGSGGLTAAAGATSTEQPDASSGAGNTGDAAHSNGADRETNTGRETNAGRETMEGGVAYVALGDSYAAGQGGGDYDGDGCPSSAVGYPALLDAEPGVRLVADASCNGDTTSDLLSTQMDDLDSDTGLVTITIGGNDLGAIRVAAVCSLAPTSADCRSMLMEARTLLAPGGELEQRLRATFAAVRADAPNARIVVTGYPNLFEGPGTGDDSEFLISTLRGATESLNEDIEAAVVAERRSGSDITFADVTEAFAGHGIGSPEQWIQSSGPDMFHPKATGYIAYADAIRAALACEQPADRREFPGGGADRLCF